MQDKSKKAKAKRPLIYKPYVKGNPLDGAAVKKGLRMLAYYLIFAFIYVLAGGALQFSNDILRVAANLLLVLACAAVLYMNGARAGEAEVTYGEIAYTRQEAGKSLDEKERQRCYHPLKGFLVALIAALPLLLLTLPHALTAQRQVYVLQALPRWVSGYRSQEEIMAPLQYYQQQVSLGFMDVLRMAVRVLVFPFANMATVDNSRALLLVDRLSPLLVCLPLLGYPLGYLTGPRSRAMVHGDISSSNKRYQRRKKREIKARRARETKKNELI